MALGGDWSRSRSLGTASTHSAFVGTARRQSKLRFTQQTSGSHTPLYYHSIDHLVKRSTNPQWTAAPAIRSDSASNQSRQHSATIRSRSGSR